MKIKNRTAQEIALYKKIALLYAAKADESEIAQDIEEVKEFVGYSAEYEKDIQEQINDINQENNREPGETIVVIPSLTPVNAVAATLGLTINAVPDTYVKNVQASALLTVADIPNVNVQSTGTITVSGTPAIDHDAIAATGYFEVIGTPEVGQMLIIEDKTFTFVAERADTYQITISSTILTQVGNIVTAINTDIENVDALSDGVSKVIITAATAGVSGNEIILEEAATGITKSGEFLEGGADEVISTLTVYDVTFSFVEERTVPGEITIGNTNDETAENIAYAISEEVPVVNATVEGAVVTIEASSEEQEFIGDGGNVIVLTESATGIAVSGAGTLTGGVSADQISIAASTYTFVDSEEPGALEIPIGEDVAETAANIVEYVDIPTVTLTADDDEVTVTAVAKGVLGNLIPLATDGTRITKSAAVTEGGIDEVLAYIEVNGKEYVFTLTGGDAPTEDYPEMIPVELALGDIAADVVDALEGAINGADENLTAVADNADVNITYNTKGVIGNEATYANYLVTAGDITDDSNDGNFADGVDGTVGYKGQMYFDVVNMVPTLFVCQVTDLTEENDNWISFEYTPPQ